MAADAQQGVGMKCFSNKTLEIFNNLNIRVLKIKKDNAVSFK